MKNLRPKSMTPIPPSFSALSNKLYRLAEDVLYERPPSTYLHTYIYCIQANKKTCGVVYLRIENIALFPSDPSLKIGYKFRIYIQQICAAQIIL